MRLIQESLEAALPAQPSANAEPSSNGSSAPEAEASIESQPEQPQDAAADSEAALSGSQQAASLSSQPGPADSGPAESANGSTARQPSDSLPAEQKSSVPPQQLLQDALAHAHKGTRLPGSSTACVLQLDTASASVSSAVLVGLRMAVYSPSASDVLEKLAEAAFGLQPRSACLSLHSPVL